LSSKLKQFLPPPTIATLHSKEGATVGGCCVVAGAVVEDASVVEGGIVVAFVVV